MEANFASTAAARLFGSDGEADIGSKCPEVLRPIAAAFIGKFSAAPEAVVASMLATCAAALGNRFKIKTRMGDQHAVAFNVVISHQSFRGLEWLGQIQGPYIARVMELQVELYDAGAAKTEREINERLADQRAAIETRYPSQDMIDRLKADICRLQARLRSRVLTDRLTIRGITEDLHRSFDHAVVAYTSSIDPVDDLSILKPAERREIARVLNLSWVGKPIAFSRGAIPGTVSLLWSTHEANLAGLGVWREFHGGSIPVPILMLASDESMKVFQPFPEMEAWQDFISWLFDARCSTEEPTTYAFTPEGDAYLYEWEEAFLEALGEEAVGLARHLVWLPKLAYRIALIMRVTREGQGLEIGLTDVEAAIAITKVLGAAHLRTLLRVIPGLTPDRTDAVDRTDRSAVMLAKIRAKGPVTRRELRRTYDDPKAEWFDPALQKLIAAGLVRQEGKNALFSCSTGGNGGGSGRGSEETRSGADVCGKTR